MSTFRRVNEMSQISVEHSHLRLGGLSEDKQSPLSGIATSNDTESFVCREPATSKVGADHNETKCEGVSQNFLSWDGPTDPENPLNWRPVKKWFNVGVVSMITLIIGLASSMFAPGVELVMAEFNNSSDLLASLVVSIYVLGLALGPLFLAPFSELYGRWICYSGFMVLFTVFTIACAVAQDTTSLLLFRFFAGTMGSSPLAIGGGTVADLFIAEERGTAIAIYTFGPVLGPSIGPIAGSYISETIGWRWIFWVLTIVTGITVLFQIFIATETYAPTLLARKAERLRKVTGNANLRCETNSRSTRRELLIQSILRPSKLMLLSPIAAYISVLSFLVYGELYLLLTTFPIVFKETYAFSTGNTGLTYLGLGMGSFISTLIYSVFSDRYYASCTKKGGAKPEDRLPFLLISGPLIAVGLFWYGWSAQEKVHWIVPILGTSLIGLGNNLFFVPSTGYLIDVFAEYSASALAATTVLRSLGGALIPLAGRSMYKTLDLGWGNTLLGILAIVLITPGLIILYKFGERIRRSHTLEL